MAQATADSAGAVRPLSEARTYPCEGCGADLEFHIGSQSLKCPHCGCTKLLRVPEHSVQENDLRVALEKLASGRLDGATLGAQEVRCGSCGAVVVFDGSLTSTECAYCASPLQRDHVHTAEQRLAVDGVLPFAVERAQASKALAAWVAGRWFAPNAFRRQGIQGEFSGLYLPFWTFDTMTATRYSGSRGTAYYVTVGTGKSQRRERRVRWTRVAGDFQYFFDDVLVCAAQSVEHSLLERIEPWPLNEVRAFDAALVAGFTAFTYDQELGEGFALAKGRMSRRLAKEVQRRIGGDEQRVDRIETHFAAGKYKHLLLPAWMLSYRYRERSYQVVVNATTAVVAGERPYSRWKIVLSGALALCVALGLFYYYRGM